jgi:hypothetical protein
MAVIEKLERREAVLVGMDGRGAPVERPAEGRAAHRGALKREPAASVLRAVRMPAAASAETRT